MNFFDLVLMRANGGSGSRGMNKRWLILISFVFIFSIGFCGCSKGSSDDGVTDEDNNKPEQVLSSKKWTGAVNIESSDSLAFNPAIALDPEGNAYVVWHQRDCSGKNDSNCRFNIYVNKYSGDAGWGKPVMIGSSQDYNFCKPYIKFDKSGNGIAYWSNNMTALGRVWVVHFNKKTGWSKPLAIDVEGDIKGEGSIYPIAALDNLGNAYARWKLDGVNWLSEYIPSKGWSDPEQLLNSGKAVNLATMGFDNNGNGLIIWEQDGGNMWIKHKTAESAGWDQAVLIDKGLGEICHKKLVFDVSGNALFVWGRRNGLIEDVYYSYFNKAGDPVKTGLLKADAEFHDLAVNSDGNAAVLFTSSDGNKSDLFSIRFSINTLSWGDAEPVESHTVAVADADIGFMPDGTEFAMWRETDGAIYSSLYNAGSGWKEAELVYQYADPDGFPIFAIRPSGEVVAVWESESGTIMANHWR